MTSGKCSTFGLRPLFSSAASLGPLGSQRANHSQRAVPEHRAVQRRWCTLHECGRTAKSITSGDVVYFSSGSAGAALSTGAVRRSGGRRAYLMQFPNNSSHQDAENWGRAARTGLPLPGGTRLSCYGRWLPGATVIGRGGCGGRGMLPNSGGRIVGAHRCRQIHKPDPGRPPRPGRCGAIPAFWPRPWPTWGPSETLWKPLVRRLDKASLTMDLRAQHLMSVRFILLSRLHLCVYAAHSTPLRGVTVHRFTQCGIRCRVRTRLPTSLLNPLFTATGPSPTRGGTDHFPEHMWPRSG